MLKNLYYMKYIIGTLWLIVCVMLSSCMKNVDKEANRKLVESIMEKLSFKGSVEEMVKWYECYSFDEVPKLRPIVGDLYVEAEKADSLNEGVSDLPECAKDVYFLWSEVLASMYTDPEGVSVIDSLCPDCRENLIRLKFSTSAWTWEELYGRGGYMTICPECPQQLDFELVVMN